MAKKHKTACGVKWRVPGILGGNAVPGWEDQQGSIVRRILLFQFLRPVTEVDTFLPAKLLAEMPSLLLKSNRAYLSALQHVGARSIWARGVLPEYFHRTRDEMAQIVNSMRGFLSSDMVQYNPSYYCPLSEIQSAWTKWIIEQHITPKPRWSVDLYTGPIEARGLTIMKNVAKTYPRNSHGSRTRTKYVIGIDLASEVDEEPDDDQENIPENIRHASRGR